MKTFIYLARNLRRVAKQDFPEHYSKKRLKLALYDALNDLEAITYIKFMMLIHPDLK